MVDKSQIQKIIDKKLLNIKKAILSAKNARDLAPSAMESHSDTTRSEKEKLINALQEELDKLDSLMENISDLKLYKIKLGEEIMKVCMVPDGLGGEKVDDIRLLSFNSPLGKEISGKKVGDKILFNNLSGIITDLK